MKGLERKDIGTLGERIAAKYLRKEGYRIVARNRHCGKYELDLIVKDKQCLAFVEVKTQSFSDPAEIPTRPSMRVDAGKRQRTVDAARAYLSAHPTKLCPRLDVIEVYLDRSTKKPFKINHIPDAFSAKGDIR